MEFAPKGDGLRYAPGVSSDESSLAIVTEHTLPIWIQHISTDTMLAIIKIWLKDTLNSNIELSRYPKVFFPYSEFCWAADTLAAVYKFYENSRNLQGMYPPENSRRRQNKEESFRRLNDETLALAFEIAILKSVMSSVLYIPPDAVDSVVDNLKEYQPPNGQLPMAPKHLPEGSMKAPRMVTKVIKSVTGNLYGHLAYKFLGNLTVLLKKPRKERWGFTFCVMILLLAVVEATQIALIDQYLLDRELDPENANRALHDGLVYLEDNFVDCPIKVFEGKYKGYNPFRSGNGGYWQDMDPATKQLVESVNKIFRHGVFLFPLPLISFFPCKLAFSTWVFEEESAEYSGYGPTLLTPVYRLPRPLSALGCEFRRDV